MKNTRFPRKALEFYRFVARVNKGLEPSFTDLPEPPNEFKIPEFEEYREDTEEEKYIQSISTYIFSLAQSINRLEDIQTYLTFTNFLSKRLSLYRTTEEAWIQYHYSNHILTTTSIYDISLHIVNAVVRLNIKEDPSYNGKVRKKIASDEKYKDIEDALKKIESSVNQHKNPRNSLVHRGENPRHNELFVHSLIDVDDILSHLNLGSEDTYRKRMMQAKRLAPINLQKELEEETENLCHIIGAFFSSLMPIYEYNLINLKQNQ